MCNAWRRTRAHSQRCARVVVNVAADDDPRRQSGDIDRELRGAGDLDVDHFHRGVPDPQACPKGGGGVADNPEAPQLGARDAVGDHRGLVLGCMARQANDGASRLSADQANPVLQPDALTIFAAFHHDVGARRRVGNGGHDRLGRAHDAGSGRKRYSAECRSFDRWPHDVLSGYCSRDHGDEHHDEADKSHSLDPPGRRRLCTVTVRQRLCPLRSELLTLNVDDGNVVAAARIIRRGDERAGDFVRAARQLRDDVVDRGRLDQVRQAVAAEQQRRIGFEWDLDQIDEVGIAGVVRLGADVTIYLVAPVVPHRLDF